MDINQRTQILVEGAKFDVSCSSSGNSTKAEYGKIGNAAAGGICHSFTADGRCVSLLKILLSNKCEYDCLYCANRRTADVARASLAPRELAEIAYNFYRRNYIEGLFLSSAVDTSPNLTMQRLTETVLLLRNEYKFNGYIHLKAIPNADPNLIEYVSRFVDRMSVNIELPTENSLKLLAPQKKKESIVLPMKQLANLHAEGQQGKNIAFLRPQWGLKGAKPIPAGQTTQLIVGATSDSDSQIIRLSEGLYRGYNMKRVYYSAYAPLGSSPLLPSAPASLKRENRLYQADWLLRFYGYKAEEIVAEGDNLDIALDPKCAWALRNLDEFPVEVNTAPYEMLLRVPGIGVKNAWRIAHARKTSKLDLEALRRLRVVLKRAIHFITINGRYFGFGLEPEALRESMVREDSPTEQVTLNQYAPELFEKCPEAKQSLVPPSSEDKISAITGEL